MDAGRDDAFEERLEALESALFQLRCDVSAARHAAGAAAQTAGQQAFVPLPAPAPERLPPLPPRRTAMTSNAALETLVAGRGLQLTGLFLVLLGAAFFLDLAFTRNWIGPAERIALGLIIGAVVLAAGASRFRGSWLLLGEGLVGLGAGILYLSIWASVAVYPELHVARGAALAAMIAVTAVLGALAAARRSERVAILGLIGGLLTPALLNNGFIDQPLLAIYLFVLAGGMLALAARCTFAVVESLVFVGLLCYTAALAPAGSWTDVRAALCASAFFVEFAAFITIAEIAVVSRARVKPVRLSLATVRAVLIALAASWYALVIEGLFAPNQTVVGIDLLAFAVVLLAASAVPRVPALLKAAYAYCGLGAVTLAIPAIFQTTVTDLDAFLIEAVILSVLGARSQNPVLSLISATLYALAACTLVLQSFIMHPGLFAGLPLMLTFAIAIGALVYVRREPVPSDDPAIARNWPTVSAGAIIVLTFFALTRLCLDLFGGLMWNTNLPSFGQFALSTVWTLYAAVLFSAGMQRASHLLRRAALVLFAVTIVKVFTVDLASMDAEYRIGIFVGLGIVLVAVSTWYLRDSLTRKADRVE